MTDPSTFRRLALLFPEAEEQDHRGKPSFRVQGKIFATLWPDENRAVLKLKPADQADLVASRPLTFSLNAWSKQGWTDLHLEHISAQECRELLEQAWRVIASKKLVRVYEEERPKS